MKAPVFLETGEPCALIVEDDVDIDIARYWNFTWKEIFIPKSRNWDVVRTAIICTGDLYVKLHLNLTNDFFLLLLI